MYIHISRKIETQLHILLFYKSLLLFNTSLQKVSTIFYSIEYVNITDGSLKSLIVFG